MCAETAVEIEKRLKGRVTRYQLCPRVFGNLPVGEAA